MRGAILLLFQWSTKSFQKEKKFFHLECEWPVTSYNKRLGTTALYSLKMLCAQYTKKEVTSMFLS